MYSPHSAGPVPPTISRRAFLTRSATAAAGLAVLSRRIRAADALPGPNERLNIAAVGIGGQGNADLRMLVEGGANVVALCDVDAEYAAHTFAEYPQARRYTDYRIMLDQEPGIDGVVIATPDHLHAVVTMAAIRHGKHVYCEKPLTRTVFEARAIATAARDAKVATQMGNQGMQFEGNRQLDAWIAEGALGPIREVHVWSDRPTQGGKLPLWWPQGVERPTDTPPVPETLDWDLWLGPAPFRPYHSAYAPFRWRGWWDFGSGGLGDMGIHNLAPVFYALNLDAPVSVTASATAQVSDSVPLAATVHYKFPARGDRPALDLHWYDGGLLPARPEELAEGEELDPEDGALYIGDRGKILDMGWGGEHPRILGRDGENKYRRPMSDPTAHQRHAAEWIAACKTGSPTRSNFAFAGPLTESVLLGALCIRHRGRRLVWDSANLRITNDPQAHALLHYEYRPGWAL